VAISQHGTSVLFASHPKDGVADVRQTFYNANSLSNLFTNVAGSTILQFLKEIDLYTKI
jgi:hypothetical protein